VKTSLSEMTREENEIHKTYKTVLSPVAKKVAAEINVKEHLKNTKL
jgi:hypothetical protein